MLNALLSRSFVAMMLLAGATSTAWAQATTYQPDQHILVRTENKGDRRCVIISVTTRPDGVVEYRVKAIDNGEQLTILDRSSSSVARSKPVENNAPKVSGSSDPLLASSLRQTAPATGQSTAYPTPASNMIAARPQLRARQAGDNTNSGIANVGGRPDSLSMNTYPQNAGMDRVAGSDPQQLQQVRYARESTTTTMADPISLGFAIPASNPRQIQMQMQRQLEQKDRLAALGETLKNALQPTARLTAAESLMENVGTDSTMARSMLMSAAANDPAAVVRAACIRSLIKIGVRDAKFQALMASAKQDSDARVRIEADQAGEMVR